MLKAVSRSIGVIFLLSTFSQAVLAQTSGFIWTPGRGLQELGPDTCARAVNDRGELCGDTWSGSATTFQAFRWSAQSGIVELPSLSGLAGSTCFAINNRGASAGAAFATAGTGPFRVRAVRWGHGGVVALGSSELNSSALDLNERGQVVGWQEVDGGVRHAYLWDKRGRGRDLGTLGGVNSTATAINNRGQVVGYSELSNGAIHAFLWTRKAGMKDLGTLGGVNSRAFDISNRGIVVGSSETPDGRQHAFFWVRRSGLVDLGQDETESGAFGVNNRGQIVGAITRSSGRREASVWFRRSHRPFSLPPNVVDSIAWATNERGAVVGFLER